MVLYVAYEYASDSQLTDKKAVVHPLTPPPCRVDPKCKSEDAEVSRTKPAQ